MKKRIRAAFLALVLVCTTLLTVAADEPITNISIVFNGSLVDYTQIDDGTSSTEDVPQIIDDWTMVPFRKTAYFYGLGVEWDDTTKTMTLTRFDGVTAVHILGTKIVFIDGVMYDFPKESMLTSDDKTLMPQRMIAEILDCDIGWDNDTRTVTLNTRPKHEPEPEPIIIVGPEIIDCYVMGDTSIDSGAAITVHITANDKTISVGLFNNNNEILAESKEYTQSANNRIFTITYTPQHVLNERANYKVTPADASGYSAAGAKDIYVYVTRTAYIASIDVKTEAPKIGQTAEISIFASASTEHIRVTNLKTKKQYEMHEFKSGTENRLFTFIIQMEEAGDNEFSVELASVKEITDSVGYFYVTQTFTVKVPEPVLDVAEAGKPEILEIDYPIGVTYSVDDTVTLTIKTSSGTEYVKTSENATEHQPSSKKDDHKEFSVTIKLTKVGENKFTIFAFSEDSDTFDSCDITFKTGEIILIRSISSRQEGSNFVLTVTVSDKVNRLTMVTADGNNVSGTPFTPIGNGQKQASFTVSPNAATVDITASTESEDNRFDFGVQEIKGHSIHRSYP